MELKALERAYNYAKSTHVQMGYAVLSDAVERFLRAQNTAKPVVSPVSPKPEPGNKDHSEFLKRMEELTKQLDKGCPACGMRGAHYCTGRKPGSGSNIDYWYNQPTAISNFDTHPRRDEILSMMGNHQHPLRVVGGAYGIAPTGGQGINTSREVQNGGQGITLGGSIGTGSGEVRGR